MSTQDVGVYACKIDRCSQVEERERERERWRAHAYVCVCVCVCECACVPVEESADHLLEAV